MKCVWRRTTVLFWSVLYQKGILTSFQRDLEMLSTECTVTESLPINLKRLLLSSRLQASCCPRCWSLRSKMRLLQCCEWADTGEEEGIKELPALCSVPLTRARTSFIYLFIYCYCIAAILRTFFFYSKHAVASRHQGVVHFIVLLK